jgi:hypothetical protein
VTVIIIISDYHNNELTRSMIVIMYYVTNEQEIFVSLPRVYSVSADGILMCKHDEWYTI